MKLFKRILRVIKIGAIAFVLLVIGVFSINKIIEKTASGKHYNLVVDVPHNRVGLLLGTAKHLQSGRLNWYYKYRIEATAELWEAKKIDLVLVSGDNSRSDYDEPSAMKDDLITKGIPADKIILDYAGFRTLDSVVRSKEIFGQDSITIISQKFHNERAIFIARKKGINAIGFNAKDVNIRYGLKVQLREKFARVKMFLDLIFATKPKFLGEKIDV